MIIAALRIVSGLEEDIQVRLPYFRCDNFDVRMPILLQEVKMQHFSSLMNCSFKCIGALLNNDVDIDVPPKANGTR